MPAPAHVTRFAPSPTGGLHLGNARTAFYNHLLARATGGRMVLRIEDTDAGRSDERHLSALIDDLHWLGIAWHEGPDVGGPHGPYRQSERQARHAGAVAALAAAGRAYPCFCSPETLAISRKAQLAAGRPPRYPGTCAALDAVEAARRVAAGQPHAIRFRVEPGRTVAFDDVVHGAQRFLTDDIGDFIVTRADGSAAFFLGNALDDADMGVTLVLRGDDHLANTPRQILILEALGRPVPSYAHLPLLAGPGGRRFRSVRVPRAWPSSVSTAGCPAPCATTWSASGTPAPGTTGSSPTQWRRGSTSRTSAGRRPATTRRSSGTGSARP